MRPNRKSLSDKEWKELSKEVESYAKKICKKFHGYHSSHEALGVLMEEFHEFVETIHDNNRKSSLKEAKQIAAGFLIYCALFKK